MFAQLVTEVLLSFSVFFSFTHSHSFIFSFSLFFFARKCLPISPFENTQWNGAISKVADTGRAEESTASVAWPDRRAALPRDTLLKQRATLKFSEDSRRLAFSLAVSSSSPPLPFLHLLFLLLGRNGMQFS